MNHDAFTGRLKRWLSRFSPHARGRALIPGEDLRLDDQRLRIAFHNAGVGIIQVESGDRFSVVNDRACQILGFNREELLGKTIHDVTAPEDRALSDRLNNELREGIHDRIEYEKRYLRRDGTRVWAHVTVSAIRDSTGRWVGSIGTINNISQQKRHQEAMRRSEERYRSLVEATSAIVWNATAAGEFPPNQTGWTQFTGQSDEDLKGQGWLNTVHPDDRARVAQAWSEAVARRQPYKIEYRLRRHDGDYRYMLVKAVPVLNDDGSVREWIGLHNDIHERKEAEMALQRQSRSLKLLSDTTSRLLMEDEPEQLIRKVFEQLAEFLEVETFLYYAVIEGERRLRLSASAGFDEDLISRLSHLDFGEGVCGTVAQTGEPLRLEHGDRQTGPFADWARMLNIQAYACYPLSARGRIVGVLSFGSRRRQSFHEEELKLLHTICDQVAEALERRRLNHELAHRARELAAARANAEAAKAAAEQAKIRAEEASRAKDHFLAVLSHELRTPLTPVLAAISMLQTEDRFDSETRELLEIVRRNLELEARLIDDLLDVTRIARGKIQLDKTPISLSEVISRAVEVCLPDIEEAGLRLDLDLECDSAWVHADIARLQQVFWNLLKNAVKFTPRGGSIGIRCQRDGDWIEAEVTDSGVGIEPDLLASIFNAFEQAGGDATAHRPGGLGLGLAICKALVEMHGGTIEAHSEGKDKGATFRVRLPARKRGRPRVSDQDPGAHQGCEPPPQPGATDPSPSRQRVLLVEDHADTARIMGRLLTRRGYEVHTAGNVAAALEQVRRERFDLLVSDLGLPDRSGIELIRELRASGHTMPAVALSGYGQDDDIQRSIEAGFNVHLIKPVNFEQFFTTLESLSEQIATA